MIRFRLDKWYLDCVTGDRDAFVGYAARLQWGFIRITYSSAIARIGDGPIRQVQSLSFNQPAAAGHLITWNEPSLRTSGEWRSGADIGTSRLIDNPDGYIDWQCLAANCAVRVSSGDRTFVGTGYVERLTMTIPPWKLPFDELRWGRFVSDDRSSYMIWIDMRGQYTQNRIWDMNGGPMEGSVGDSDVTTHDSKLTILDSLPFRNGNVAESVFGRFAFLKFLLPRGIRSIREEKRISTCSLDRGGIVSSGTSIDEVVTWGRD